MSKQTLRTCRRFLEDPILERLREEPVIILNGARTAGKSTVLRSLAARLDVRLLDLDEPATRSAVAADPALFASGPSPVLVDEFQHVLELLDAVKAELNRDLRPGRFVLAGSTRYSTLPAAAQALTGRAHLMTLWPFSQGELAGKPETFIDRLLDDPAQIVREKESTTPRSEYVRRTLVGGFPLAASRESERGRARWFADYATLVLERDLLDIRRVRQREVLPRLLRLLVAQTAQVLNVTKAANQIGTGIAVSVAEDYARLLEAVFLVHRLPAWGATLKSRVAAHPKIHVVDSGLGGYLLNLTAAHVESRDPAVLTVFGHLVESFAVNEVLKQAGRQDVGVRPGHFRTHDGEEVDLVLECDDGRVVGVEVKASGQVHDRDLCGLRLLSRRLGNRFIGGVALYLGAHAYTAGDRIHVLPLDHLWKSRPAVPAAQGAPQE
jgi:predicted AAA+ superfamily ATPase